MKQNKLIIFPKKDAVDCKTKYLLKVENKNDYYWIYCKQYPRPHMGNLFKCSLPVTMVAYTTSEYATRFILRDAQFIKEKIENYFKIKLSIIPYKEAKNNKILYQTK